MRSRLARQLICAANPFWCETVCNRTAHCLLLRTTLCNAQDALNAIPLERHPFILKDRKRFDVCEVGMVETERRLKVKRMTTSQETRYRVGVPGYLGPMRAWTLVIEMIAKPALPIWFSKIAWHATCNINRTQFRSTPDWRWSDCSLQSRIKNNQSKRKHAMRKQSIRRCEADATYRYPISLAIKFFIKWSIKCQ